MRHKWLILIFFIFIQLVAQDVDKYLSLVRAGRLGEVRNTLPGLLSKFPNDPGVLFLKALMTVDGESAIQQYRSLTENFPDSPYADDAAMKEGEYLYARGLYSQASVQLRSIPMNYPNSEHIQRAVDLMVKSYDATGELDSSRHYLPIFKQKYPDLDIGRYGITAMKKVVKTQPKVLIKGPVGRPIAGSGPWVVQVGAFKKYSNARRLKMNLNQNGYKVTMDEIMANRQRLYVVRVVRYVSREDANQVGIELKNKFGLDFRVLKKPGN